MIAAAVVTAWCACLAPLGCPDYRVRERAEAALPAAVAAAGLDHPDPEVAERCRRALSRAAAGYVYGGGWCDRRAAWWWAAEPRRLGALYAACRRHHDRYWGVPDAGGWGPPDPTFAVLAFANYARSLATDEPIPSTAPWADCARLSHTRSQRPCTATTSAASSPGTDPTATPTGAGTGSRSR